MVFWLGGGFPNQRMSELVSGRPLGGADRCDDMRCVTISGIGSRSAGREGHVGGTAADNRLFVEAVLFRFRAGVPWRDLHFGDWKIVYQRFNRWAKSGVLSEFSGSWPAITTTST